MGSYSKLEHGDTEERRKQEDEQAPSFANEGSLPHQQMKNTGGTVISADIGAMTPSQTTAAAQTPKHHHMSPRTAERAGASIPADASHSENFYLHIEKQPQLSIDHELQIQQQIRLLQKQIRLKNEQVKKQIQENGQQLVIMEESLEMKQRLQRVAQQMEQNEHGEGENEQGKSPEESKHESREHTQSTAVCHQASLKEVVEVGKKDECQ